MNTPLPLALATALTITARWCCTTHATHAEVKPQSVRPTTAAVRTALVSALAEGTPAAVRVLSDMLTVWSAEASDGTVYDSDALAGAILGAVGAAAACTHAAEALEDARNVPEAPEFPTCEACGERPVARGLCGPCAEAAGAHDTPASRRRDDDEDDCTAG